MRYIDFKTFNSYRKMLFDTINFEPVTLVRNGFPVAVLVSPEEYERLNGVPDKQAEITRLFSGE